ncbi:MAG TPA: tRNA adenosine deaminase-associated protein [Actinopolymorphaceae bacterium]
MSYFATALAKIDGEWQGSELDLDEVEGLEDVADAALALEPEDGLVIVLVEHDHWFGIVRVQDDDEPRTYVSDASEAARTSLGELLLPELAARRDFADLSDIPDVAELDESDDELSDVSGSDLPDGPMGEVGLLDDLGVTGGDLTLIATKTGLPPTDAIVEIAGRIGAAEALEELR